MLSLCCLLYHESTTLGLAPQPLERMQITEKGTPRPKGRSWYKARLVAFSNAIYRTSWNLSVLRIVKFNVDDNSSWHFSWQKQTNKRPWFLFKFLKILLTSWINKTKQKRAIKLFILLFGKKYDKIDFPKKLLNEKLFFRKSRLKVLAPRLQSAQRLNQYFPFCLRSIHRAFVISHRNSKRIFIPFAYDFPFLSENKWPTASIAQKHIKSMCTCNFTNMCMLNVNMYLCICWNVLTFESIEWRPYRRVYRVHRIVLFNSDVKN